MNNNESIPFSMEMQKMIDYEGNYFFEIHITFKGKIGCSGFVLKPDQVNDPETMSAHLFKAVHYCFQSAYYDEILKILDSEKDNDD